MLETLQDFWQTNTANFTLYYIIGIILCVFLVRKYVSKILATFVFNFLQKKGRTIYKDGFFKLLVKPLQQFLIWIVIIFALEKLYLPKTFTAFAIVGKITFGQIFGFLAVCVIVFVFLTDRYYVHNRIWVIVNFGIL